MIYFWNNSVISSAGVSTGIFCTNRIVFGGKNSSAITGCTGAAGCWTNDRIESHPK